MPATPTVYPGATGENRQTARVAVRRAVMLASHPAVWFWSDSVACETASPEDLSGTSGVRTVLDTSGRKSDSERGHIPNSSTREARDRKEMLRHRVCMCTCMCSHTAKNDIASQSGTTEAVSGANGANGAHRRHHMVHTDLLLVIRQSATCRCQG